jgi:hypothetical protein
MDAAALAKIGANMGQCLAKYVVDNCATCLMCRHFEETKEQCNLNGLRPPARVIAYGCEKFETTARI